MKRTSSLRINSFIFCLPFSFEMSILTHFCGVYSIFFLVAEVERLSIRRFGELCETCCDQGVTWILMPFFSQRLNVTI